VSIPYTAEAYYEQMRRNRRWRDPDYIEVPGVVPFESVGLAGGWDGSPLVILGPTDEDIRKKWATAEGP
jgi:hypothetical protein